MLDPENRICVHPDVLLALLTELGKHRALADHETDIIEAIVCRGHRSTGLRIRWAGAMDRRLVAAAKSRGGVRQFAERNGIPPKAAYDRLSKLRKAKATKKGRKG